MKHITTLVVAFLLFVNLHAQDQDAIRKEAQKYYAIMESQDLTKSLDYAYPKLYDIVPKEDMVKALDAVLNNGVFKVTLTEFNVGKISNTLEKDGVKYALVSYSQKISMQLIEKVDKSVTDKMVIAFKEKYGDQNVSFDTATSTFLITPPSSMFAIKDPKYGSDWKFLENRDDMNEILPQLMPTEVISALK